MEGGVPDVSFCPTVANAGLVSRALRFRNFLERGGAGSIGDPLYALGTHLHP